MKVQLHVLASGSSGNASVLEVGGACLLVDFGLPVRSLTRLLRKCRLSWDRLDAAILTHTHGDHWQASTISQLAERRLPFHCHPEHAEVLTRDSPAFTELMAAGMVRYYQPGERLTLLHRCICMPILVSHDAPATCGFRFEGTGADAWSVGYAADLGCWTAAQAALLADVDLLALEFNHDVAMQLTSGRHPTLVRRVLGDCGHLSNDQAAAFCAEVLAISRSGRLRSLVQLHLSRDCNDPAAARRAARAVVDRFGQHVEIHTMVQGGAPETIRVGALPPVVIQPTLDFGVPDAEAP